MKNILRKLSLKIKTSLGLSNLYDLMVHAEVSARRRNHINPLNKFSMLNGFSQHDEDGITLQILDRIGVKKGYFVEFGVGDGTENNTLILLASNWKGAWFGGEDLAFDTSSSHKLNFEKTWISKDNILSLYESLNENADVISLDLDGNDFYLVEELLSNKVKPKLFIVEYNAKFPPQVEFKIKYETMHAWGGDDYFGASLKSYTDLFSSYGYSLICCNLSGANAFFIDTQYSHCFSDIPNNIEDIYCEPFYFLRNQKMHPTSVKTISNLIH